MASRASVGIIGLGLMGAALRRDAYSNAIIGASRPTSGASS